MGGELGELGDLGSRLREERERAHISQRELARRLGVSASLISQIESGQSKPSVSTLYAIVSELGVSLDYVFRVHEHELSIATAVGGGTTAPDVGGHPGAWCGGPRGAPRRAPGGGARVRLPMGTAHEP